MSSTIEPYVHPLLRPYPNVAKWIEVIREIRGDKFADRCEKLMDPTTPLQELPERQFAILKVVADGLKEKLPWDSDPRPRA